MKRQCILIPLLIALLPLLVSWVTDPLLGDGFREQTIDQGSDYSGPVVSTVVRRLPPGESPRKGVLYIHGYNDYFFQDSMAMLFNDSGYAFYAVDLRKYGRSLRPGQTRYQVRNLAEYFPDIDSAVALMQASGVRDIVLMGHSTGGLIAALYMEHDPSPDIKALVLNSPFLDWNFTGFTRHVLIPCAAALGRWFPNISIPQGDDPAYGQSLLRKYHGEWDFDTTKKLLHAAPVTTGWIRAINQGQKELMKAGPVIKVPILLMHSRRSVSSASGQWTPEVSDGDAVLNVDSIDSRGRRLGRRVTVVTVDGGLHDLVLSRPAVRRAVYNSIFRFCRKNLPATA